MNSPNNPPNPSPSDIARFWSKVERGGDDECWPWKGHRGPRGYGSLHVNGKGVRAHRFSWSLHNDTDPTGLFVCHRCDNPSCCNPGHLFLGTPADNTHDMVAKGRHRRRSTEEGVKFARGERVGTSKLTESDVIAIRDTLQKGCCMSALAREYGVNRKVIWQIGKRRLWAHV